ncbi:hypothetical protein RNZ50_02940 [Paracoccaceae bacterium Fryx2]|nr:hypothetical protein [Paracoccaceae bacterium Fryx2]
MALVSDVAGMAALSICESLLLALNDRSVLAESEIIGILTDAAAAHQSASEKAGGEGPHGAAAALINGIIDGGNSVRHPRS